MNGGPVGVDPSGGRYAAAPASLVTAHVGGYDPSRQVYGQRPGQLRRFRAAAGAAVAGTGVCEIGVLGDSIDLGQTSTSLATAPWPVRMRDRLGTLGLPNSGTGWVAAANNTTLDARWVYGAGWSAFGQSTHYATATTNAAVLTFTSDKAGTVVEVLYGTFSGTFTVKIDGGAAVPVNPNGTGNPAIYQVTGLANTVHTVVITTTSASAVFIYAARVRAVAGVSVSNWGFSGARASDFAIQTSNYQAPSMMAATSPALMILGFMTNEVNTSVAAATYQANLTALAALFPTSDIALRAAPPASGLDLTRHRDALYSMADALNLPVIDFYDRWGSWATANSLALMSDAFHPNDAGYADLGLAASSLVVAG